MRIRVGSAVLELVLVALCVLLALMAPGFFTADNLLNVLRNVSMQGLIALGMTMVIIAGEIDLSVGSAVAFAGCMTAFLTERLSRTGVGLPMEAAIALAVVVVLLTGFGLGSFSGFMRIRYQVPTFITTLALMTGLTGAAELITNGFPLTPFPEWYNFIGGGYLLGLPVPALVFLIAFGLFFVVMNHTSDRAAAVGDRGLRRPHGERSRFQPQQ